MLADRMRMTASNKKGLKFKALTLDPAYPPNANVSCIALSPDSTYLAVGVNYTSGRYVRIYKRSGDSYLYIQDIALSTQVPNSLSFNKDGTYLALVQSGAIRIYKRNGDSFESLTYLGSSGNYQKAVFASGSDYLAVTSTNTDANVFELYKQDNDAFTRLSNGGGVGVCTASYGVDIDPTGTYIAVMQNHTTYQGLIYKRVGDTYTSIQQITNGGLTGAGRTAKFDSKGNYLCVGTNASTNFLGVLKRSGDTFNWCTVDVQTSLTPDAVFTIDGKYLITTDSTNARFYTYSDTEFTRVTELITTGSTSLAALASNGDVLALTITTAPRILIYD